MFITPLTAPVTLISTAAAHGCKFGTVDRPYAKSSWDLVNALGGNTFSIKDQLKAAGFKFHGVAKVWYHPEADETQIEAILNSLN